jgi:DNA-binding transcriptional regulator YiaG
MKEIDLKLARETMGLNIKEMASILDVSRSTYNHWERCERKMTGASPQAVRLLMFIYVRGMIDDFLTEYPKIRS